MEIDSFFPRTGPHYGLPQAETILWEVATGGGPTAVLDLPTIKNFLNIPLEDTAFDAEKEMFLTAAQTAIEAYCQLSIKSTTWTGYAPRFLSQMRINRRPFASITSVQYVTPDTGTITTLDPSQYVVGKAAQRCGVVALADGCQWPDTANRPDAVIITAVSGWAKPDIPQEIISAMLMTIAALDKARDGDAGGGAPRTVYAMKHTMAPSIIPNEAKAMLARYKMLTFGAA